MIACRTFCLPTPGALLCATLCDGVRERLVLYRSYPCVFFLLSISLFVFMPLCCWLTLSLFVSVYLSVGLSLSSVGSFHNILCHGLPLSVMLCFYLHLFLSSCITFSYHLTLNFVCSSHLTVSLRFIYYLSLSFECQSVSLLVFCSSAIVSSLVFVSVSHFSSQ